MENNEYIKKYLAGTLTDEEQRAFEQTTDYLELKKLDDHLQYFKAPVYQVEDEYDVLSNKLSKSTQKKEGKEIKVNWWQPVMKIAAAIILMVVVGYALYDQLTTSQIQTQLADQGEFYLPDSSKVLVNAESVIAYKARDWDENRSLELEGEAFFKVAKGSKFDVNTDIGKVTVLGTEFNVIVRDNYFEVVCYEGLVQVTHNDNVERLEPGKMFRVLNEEVVVSNISIGSKPSWTSNESSFISMPYSYVIGELQRQYDRRIQVKSVNTKQLYTGSFVHGNIDLALQSLTEPLNLSYTIKDNEIIITGGE